MVKHAKFDIDLPNVCRSRSNLIKSTFLDSSHQNLLNIRACGDNLGTPGVTENNYFSVKFITRRMFFSKSPWSHPGNGSSIKQGSKDAGTRELAEQLLPQGTHFTPTGTV